MGEPAVGAGLGADKANVIRAKPSPKQTLNPFAQAVFAISQTAPDWPPPHWGCYSAEYPRWYRNAPFFHQMHRKELDTMTGPLPPTMSSATPWLPSESPKDQEFNQDWLMPWNEIAHCLGELSLFETKGLCLKNLEECHRFLVSHGYDISIKEQKKSLEVLFLKSLQFLRHVILNAEERLALDVPMELITMEDPRKVLLLSCSSEPRKIYKKRWSCAILKVAFTLHSVENDPNYRAIGEARELIFQKLKKRLFPVRDSQGYVFRHQDSQVHLHQVIWKELKTKESIALKFLHKSDVLSEGVFDYIGVRFVVAQASDALRLLKLLIDTQIVLPHLVITSRTRNTLLNFNRSKRFIEMIQELHAIGTLSSLELENYLSKVPWQFSTHELLGKGNNAHSSNHYRSLQITVKQAVRTANPAHMALKSVLNQLSIFKSTGSQDPWLLQTVPEELFQQFPLEIQILDQKSFDAASDGAASHFEYKQSQLQTVRARVVGDLLRDFYKPKRTTPT